MDSFEGKATARNIPLPIQRAVRQRCGFGCVICGLPLYEYEHMMEWAVVQRHVAEEITLLCDKHHREKTNGLLPKEAVSAANENPFNLRTGVSAPYDLHYSGDHCTTVIGDNTFTTKDQGHGTQIIPLMIDGIPILGFILSDGHLLLNVNIFDEFNELALRIQNNVLTYSTSSWDVALTGRDLKIRESHGKFFLDMRFETPNMLRISRGRFLLNGVEVKISPTEVVITNNQTRMSGSRMENVTVGLSVGTEVPNVSAGVVLQGIPRYTSR